MRKIDAWIARDKDGFLCLFLYERPVLKGYEWIPNENRVDAIAILDIKDYPNVTFENSPIKVSITKP